MNRLFAGTLRLEHVGQTISLNGWVQKQRDFGDLIFIDLRDRSGVCQVVIARGRGADDATVNAAKDTRGAFVLRIAGTAAARAAHERNTKLQTGAAEVVANAIAILHGADTPT